MEEDGSLQAEGGVEREKFELIEINPRLRFQPYELDAKRITIQLERSSKGNIRLPGGERIFKKEELASAITKESYRGEENKEDPRLLVPVFVNGVGDWIRASQAIRDLRSVQNQEVSLICLDTPVARDFIDTQLEGVVNNVFWLPMTSPFYNGEPSASLDRRLTDSHAVWQEAHTLVSERMADEDPDRGVVTIHNPNYSLPPYEESGEPFEFDYRLALFGHEDPSIGYEISSASQAFADKWWGDHVTEKSHTFAVSFRENPNLSQPARNSNRETMKKLIDGIEEKHGDDVRLLFYGDAPDPVIAEYAEEKEIEVTDFCEAWKEGVSLNEQAAVISRSEAVFGYNSGGLDLGLCTGKPGIRLRGRKQAHPYFNDLIQSPLTVNVERSAIKDPASVVQATKIFFNEMDRLSEQASERRAIYVCGDGNYKRERLSLDPIETSQILRGKKPEVKKVLVSELPENEEEGILFGMYKKGVIPVVVGGDEREAISRVLEDGYGYYYLDQVPTGAICRPEEATRVIKSLEDDTDKAKLMVSAGFYKYLARWEGGQFVKMEEDVS